MALVPASRVNESYLSDATEHAIAHAPPRCNSSAIDRRGQEDLAFGSAVEGVITSTGYLTTLRIAMQTVSLYIIAALFVGAGFGHFLWPGVFKPLVPPYLPRPLLLVYLSGLAEVAGGIGVLISPIRPYAGYGLILLLCALFPVHVYMAREPGHFPGIPLWALYMRVPLQFVLVAWVYWAACRPEI